MRIISGKFKGFRFTPPAKKWPTRPTTDISKEGLYNILQNRIDFEEVRFLDLFGGTGNHCYEFISRGCSSAVYVDRYFPAIQFVKNMSEKLEISDELEIVRADVFKFIEHCERNFDVIFAGPPYALKTIDTIPSRIINRGLLASKGLLILEHNPNVSFSGHTHLVEQRNYGKTIFSFFSID